MMPATAVVSARGAPDEADAMPSLGDLREELAMLEGTRDASAKRRHFAQCECDATRRLFDAAKQRADRLENMLRSTDVRLEEMEEGQRLEVQVYEHKVSHLTYQHQTLLVHVEAGEEMAEEEEHFEHAERAAAVRTATRNLGRRKVAMQAEQETEVRRMKEQFEKLYRRRHQELFEDRLTHLRERLDKRMQNWRERALFRTKMNAYELTERKNEHIRTLSANHERAFGQMKEYYTAIARNNVAIINEYRTSLEQIKRRIGTVREEAEAVAVENAALRAPLAETLATQQQLAAALALWDKDRASLAFAKQRLTKSRKTFAKLQRSRDALKAQLRQVEDEVESLKEAFEEGVEEIRERNAGIGDGLERDARTIEAEIDKMDEQVHATATGAALDPGAMAFIANATHHALQAQSDDLVTLRNQVQSAQHRCGTAFRIFRAKLLKAGIPAPEVDALGLSKEATAPEKVV